MPASRFATSTSETARSAPAWASRRARFEPTWPRPATTIRRPDRSGEPKRSLAQARIAASTPSAVNGLGSPRATVVGRQPGHVAGPLADHHQVLGGDADVLGRDVAAAERLDRVAEVQQQRTAVLADGRRSLRGADHSLAPAELQPGRRGLVGHAPRQPEGIAGAVDRRLVVPQTDASKGRPEGGRVDGDDHVPAAAPSLAHDEVLVVEVDRRDGGGQGLGGVGVGLGGGPSRRHVSVGPALHAHAHGLTPHPSSRSLTDPRKRAASAPSSARWSHDMHR